jgi:hypothetical protein
MKLEFSERHLQKHSHIDFMKIHQLGGELFKADGRTDGNYDANNRFSQFCERT